MSNEQTVPDATAAGRVLGRRAAGVPKTITPERRAELQAHMAVVNENRREKFRLAAGTRVVKPAAPPPVKAQTGKLVRHRPQNNATAPARFTTATVYSGA